MSVLLQIDTSDTRPIYIQIMDEVRRAIVVETLGPDSLLPSVRQLATDLRINPNTVQQAYRELEREGLIYVRRGQGTFVSASARPEGEKETLSIIVAQNALREAHRHGLEADELISAIKKMSSRMKRVSDKVSKGVSE